MSWLREWLPVTKRNRVALGFVGAALLTFVAWKLLPLGYDEILGSPAYIFVWPVIFSSLIDYRPFGTSTPEE